MKQKFVQWWSGVFSASILMAIGCTPLDTDSDGIVEAEAEADTEAEASGEMTISEPSGPDQGAATRERAGHEGQVQTVSASPAPLMVNGVTILSGEVPGSSTYTYWPLGSGSGERQATIYVWFSGGYFSQPPAVVVSLGQFSTNTNLIRSYVKVSAQSVSTSGFNLVFTTSSDSIVNSATARWIAYGPT